MNKNFLTPEEIKIKLLNKIPDSFIRDRAIIELLYKTGLRVKELINIRKDDIDLNNHNQITPINITGKHERTIFINNETFNLIKKMLEKRKKESDFLFITRTGKQLNRVDVENIIKKYRINDNITANTLKQSYINFMLNNANFTVEEVKKLVGQEYLSIKKTIDNVDSDDLKNKYKQIIWPV